MSQGEFGKESGLCFEHRPKGLIFSPKLGLRLQAQAPWPLSRINKTLPNIKSILSCARLHHRSPVGLDKTNESPVGDVGGQRGSWGTQFPRAKFLTKGLIFSPKFGLRLQAQAPWPLSRINKTLPNIKNILSCARLHHRSPVGLDKTNKSPVGDVGGQRGSWGTQFPRTKFLTKGLMFSPKLGLRLQAQAPWPLSRINKTLPNIKSILSCARLHHRSPVGLDKTNESPVGDVGGHRGSGGQRHPELSS